MCVLGMNTEGNTMFCINIANIQMCIYHGLCYMSQLLYCLVCVPSSSLYFLLIYTVQICTFWTSGYFKCNVLIVIV